MNAPPDLPWWKRPRTWLAAYVALWCLLWIDWTAWRRLWDTVLLLGFLPAPILAGWWISRAFDLPALKTDWRAQPGGLRARVSALPALLRHHALLPKIPLRWRLTWCAIPIWQFVVFLAHLAGNRPLSKLITDLGTIVVFVVGLFWVIWYVERESRARRRRRPPPLPAARHAYALESMAGDDDDRGGRWIWDPRDLAACYYGREKRKLKQSLLSIAAYLLCFVMFLSVLTHMSGCREIYEMPAGGGEVAQIQQVQVKKVIKKKFVVNPYSAVLFNPPPIEEVELQLEEATKHAYTVGYGQGAGAGFAGGTSRGKVRFIRLEYNGGDWDQDFGIGADLNLLIEYGVRTRHKTAKTTESRKISQLANFPKGKSPPFVYMTGQKNIHVSKKEIEILREFVTDKHGMIFADNGGSRRWHDQFFSMMRSVLPKVKPVRIPLDHPVHRVPYPIPFLPYVAPHGGKDAYGWVVDGRLAAYYHPGDIGDAWSDGHAGVKREIWELCYQLGVNVVFYAHAEYNRWLDGQGGTDE